MSKILGEVGHTPPLDCAYQRIYVASLFNIYLCKNLLQVIAINSYQLFVW